MVTVPQLLSGKEDESDVAYEIDDVTDNSEGYYKCVIQTSRGGAEGITFLDVEVGVISLSGSSPFYPFFDQFWP